MGWDGDISRMGKLQDRIADLASVPSRASRRVADEVANLIEEEFGAQADPYGTPWEPHAEATVQRWGPHPILQLTQEMRSSVDVRPMAGAGVSVTIDHPAAPHQTGWSGPQGEGPARPMLPAGEMPAKWREAIMGAVSDEVRGTLA